MESKTPTVITAKTVNDQYVAFDLKEQTPLVTKHNCFDTNIENIFDKTVNTPNSTPTLSTVFKVQCESRYHQAEQLYFSNLKAELEEFSNSFAKSIDLKGLSGCAACDPRIGYLYNEKINDNKLLKYQVRFIPPTNNSNGHYQVTRRFKPNFEKYPTGYDTAEITTDYRQKNVR